VFDFTYQFDPHQGGEVRSPPQPPTPDLRFTVVDSDGQRRGIRAITVIDDGREMPIARIAESADAPFIVFNVARRCNVDLYVGDSEGRVELSEFEAVENRVAPVMQDLAYDELDEKQYEASFLAAEAGVTSGVVDRLFASAAARRVMSQRGRPVPVEVFYGLAHAGLPLDLPALSRHSRQSLNDALVDAVAQAVIPKRLERDIERHLDDIVEAACEMALTARHGGGGDTPAAWLELSGLTGEAQRRLLREMADHDGDLKRLFEVLRGDETMGGEETVRRTEMVLRLASFTGRNLPLVPSNLDIS
jgi:hypothetical protein